MGSRDFQTKHYSTEPNTCSVCSVTQFLKITLAAVLQRLYRCQNFVKDFVKIVLMVRSRKRLQIYGNNSASSARFHSRV